MKPSIYNVFLEKSDHVLAYNSRSIAFASLTKDQYSVAQQYLDGKIPASDDEKGKDLFQKLVKGQFLVEDDLDELKLLQIKNRMARYAAKGLGMVLAPTLKCNFACEYCYVDLNAKKMSKANQEKLCRFVDNKLPENSNFSLCWTGGDPSIAMDVVMNLSQEFMEICKRKNSNFDPVMITNGYRLDDTMLQQVKDAGIHSIQVTLDGFEPDHDAHRFLRGRKPTFHRIMENVEKACKEVFINLRINVDKRNVARMNQLLDFLVERGLNREKMFQVYFAKVDAINEQCQDYSDHCFTSQEYAVVEAGLLEELTKRGFRLAVNSMRQTRRTFCGANSRNHWVVDPHVNLLKCYTDFGMADKYGVGYIDDAGKEVIDKPLNYIKWMGWDPFEIEECRSCKVLPVCMGGCSYKVITKGLGIEHACIKLRFSLEETLSVIGDRIREKKQTSCSIEGGCPV